VPVYAEKTKVIANRIDARVVDKQKVLLLEMSCPWMAKRKHKEEEKNLEVSTAQMGDASAVPTH